MAAGQSTLKERFADLASDAHAALSAGRYAESEKQFRDLIQLQRRAWGPEHADTLCSQTDHALALTLLGRHAEAEAIYCEVLQVMQQSPEFGMEHKSTLASVTALGHCVLDQSRYKEAEPMLRKVHALHVRLLGSRDWATLDIQTALAKCLTEDKQYEEAEGLLRDALDGYQALKASPAAAVVQAQKVGMAMFDLGKCMFDTGKYVEAESRLRAAVKHTRHHLGEVDGITLECMALHARSLDRLGRHAEAEVMHRLAVQGSRATRGWGSPEAQSFALAYVDCLAAQQKVVLVEALLRNTLSHVQQAVGEDQPGVELWMRKLAIFLQAQGESSKRNEAKALLRRARELCCNRPG